MYIPVRCFTCGAPIGGSIWKKYKKLIAEGKSPEEAIKELNLKRYCCIRMILGGVECAEDIAKTHQIKKPHMKFIN